MAVRHETFQGPAMRLGPIIKSVLGTAEPLRCVQVGWDRGESVASLVKSVPKAKVKVLVWGNNPTDIFEGAEVEKCDIYKAKFGREWDLVIIPSEIEEFVMCFYMALEDMVVEGGCVAVVGQEFGTDRGWLFDAMIIEKKMIPYSNREKRSLSLFRHEGGKLTREL